MKFDLVEFKNFPATNIVSLGPLCSTAYNLRRYFGFGDAFPFDWWITPHTGIVRILDRFDVNLLYDEAQLELTPGRQSMVSKAYGIRLHHEFDRDRRLPGGPIKEGWENCIPRAKQRTQYLVEKLLKLDHKNQRILFVREVTQSDQARELVSLLSEKFANADWSLAAIPSPGSPAGYNWKGNPRAWDETLGAIGVSLDTSNMKPFKEVRPEQEAKRLEI